MNTEQMDGAEKALAKEFSDYLANVSREIVEPISANVGRHQSDLEKMLSKVADARSQVESEFGRQRQFMDAAREQVDLIIKESEAKLGRLHSAHQSLLDSTRQRIVADLKAVSDDAGATVALISTENKSTRDAVAAHHQSMRKLADENRNATARIIDDAKGALDQTFAAHQKEMEHAASSLLLGFGKIAEDVKVATGSFAAVHEETRVRLFTEFSAYRDAAGAQIDAARESLSLEISERIDFKSQEAINTVGNGIAKRYEEQFASLEDTIDERFDAAGHSEEELGDRLEAAVSKSVADATRILAEGHAETVGRLQRDISTVRNLLICLIVVTGGAVAFGLAFRF
jgi:gas vesicle protein